MHRVPTRTRTGELYVEPARVTTDARTTDALVDGQRTNLTSLPKSAANRDVEAVLFRYPPSHGKRRGELQLSERAQRVALTLKDVDFALRTCHVHTLTTGVIQNTERLFE